MQKKKGGFFKKLFIFIFFLGIIFVVLLLTGVINIGELKTIGKCQSLIENNKEIFSAAQKGESNDALAAYAFTSLFTGDSENNIFKIVNDLSACSIKLNSIKKDGAIFSRLYMNIINIDKNFEK